jgi:hypothetical protein
VPRYVATLSCAKLFDNYMTCKIFQKNVIQ